VIVEASLLNISRSGVAVTHPPRPIGADRIVRLTIEVPGLLRPIEVDARVMARTEDRIGFAFVGLRLEEAARIGEVMARHGAPPGRRETSA
jgi:hypothetical protein